MADSVLAACGLLISLSSAALDTFGITQMHPTKSGTREWNLAHWANGTARLVIYDGDAFDPTGWTDNHSSGDDSLYIDGKGTLRLKGQGPRFHLNSTSQYSGSGPAQKVPPQSFVNVEATGYFRRITTGGPAYAGAEIQVRTGPLAHGSGVYSTKAGSGAPTQINPRYAPKWSPGNLFFPGYDALGREAP